MRRSTYRSNSKIANWCHDNYYWLQGGLIVINLLMFTWISLLVALIIAGIAVHNAVAIDGVNEQDVAIFKIRMSLKWEYVKNWLRVKGWIK